MLMDALVEGTFSWHGNEKKHEMHQHSSVRKTQSIDSTLIYKQRNKTIQNTSLDPTY